MKRVATQMSQALSARWLILCAIITVTMMAMTPADERRVSQADSRLTPQDTGQVKYDRTFRTTFTDKSDNSLRKIELRYKGGVLVEIVVDGEKVPEKDFHKYSEAISKAEADAEKIRKDLLAMEEDIRKAMQDIEVDLKRATEEIGKVDFDVINEEVRKNMEVVAYIGMDQIREAVERARIETERARSESRIEIDRAREEVMREIERARGEISRVRAEGETIRERGDFDKISRDRMIILPDGPEPVVSAKKREEMHKKLEELEKKGAVAMV